jgi:hypothetical protein
MMHLLKTAYNANGKAAHFVFLSGNSIPLKSFDFVYNELMTSDKSRFCLSGISEVMRAWGQIYQQLGLSKKDLAKGGQWSIISRKHVKLILEHEETLSTWNEAFIDARKSNVSPIGAPDATFFPAIIHQFAKEEFHTCDGELKPEGNDHGYGCCPTVTKWVKRGEDVINSTNTGIFKYRQPCSVNGYPNSPCTFNSFREDALREQIDKPFSLFLRKVDASATVQADSGEVLPLAEALPMLFAGKHLVGENDIHTTLEDPSSKFSCPSPGLPQST